MKQWRAMYQNVLLLTQFGLSFITPILICLAICWWLTSHLGFGGWVYVPGFFFGLGGSCMVAYKFYLAVVNREQKEEKRKKVSYNKHL